MTILQRVYAKQSRIFYTAGPLEILDVPPPPGCAFREFTAEDFRAGAIFLERDRMAKFARRLAEGHRCFGHVDAGGEVASYLWYTRCGVAVPWALHIPLHLAAGEAYIWDCRTKADMRGRGLYPSGLQNLRKSAGSHGVSRLYIDCEPDNEASIRGIERAGLAAFHRMDACRLGFLRFIRSPGGLPHSARSGIWPGQLLKQAKTNN
jgi:RimJ/RimL family protein N-acetyltransferase